MKGKGVILALIYAQPERYPPTLNALEYLAEQHWQIGLIYRPQEESRWPFHKNISLHPAGPVLSARQQEASSLLTKARLFLQFLFDTYVQIKKQKPDWIIAYDAFTLLAVKWIDTLGFLPENTRIWYHSHDLIFPEKRWNLAAMGKKAETDFMPRLGIFSLPSETRWQYFNLENFSGKRFFLPNFPRLNFYSKYYQPAKIDKLCKLVYQGTVSEEHGLEALIAILQEQPANKKIQLTIIGRPDEAYKNTLIELAIQYGVQGQLHFVDRIPYHRLPEETRKHHIGVAFLNPFNPNHATAATASNKIFEYAALGLPVLYTADPVFVKEIGNVQWAIPSTLDKAALLSAISSIIQHYEALQSAAHQDFESQFHFEIRFKQIAEYLQVTSGQRGKEK
jgi:glycosyltransferase involved in cell wall biosynthesis